MAYRTQAEWFQDDATLTLTLPEGFVFDSLPDIASGNPLELVLGTPVLSAENDAVMIPIIENLRLDALTGIDIQADIWSPAGLAPGDYWCSFACGVDISPVGDAWNVQQSVSDAITGDIGFVAVPEPATVMLSGLLAVAILGNRRQSSKKPY